LSLEEVEGFFEVASPSEIKGRLMKSRKKAKQPAPGWLLWQLIRVSVFEILKLTKKEEVYD